MGQNGYVPGQNVSCLRIVVSCENTPGFAWQTQLLCYSALTRLQQHPIIIVHQTADPLLIEFEILREMGFQVVQAPSFASTLAKLRYPPRNMAGTLLTVAELSNLDAQRILLCEPDMLFTGPVACPFEISGELCPQLDYSQDRIKAVASRSGCERFISSLNEAPRVCAPYVLPVNQLRRIGTRWLELLDSFKNLERADAMYALGLALTIEKLNAGATQMVDVNFDSRPAVSGCIIHYRHGNAVWDKRFFTERSAFDVSDVALPKGEPGTVFDVIMTQIRLAKAYFRKQSSTIGPLPD
jgi:hypothetical protein